MNNIAKKKVVLPYGDRIVNVSECTATEILTALTESSILALKSVLRLLLWHDQNRSFAL